MRAWLIAWAFAVLAVGQAVGVLSAQVAISRAEVATKPPITALALTPDGLWVVVGSQAGLELRTWPELELARNLTTELTNVHDLAFSPDDKVLAAAGGEPGERGTVELWDWPAEKLLQRLHPHHDLIYAVAWRFDSKVFATGSADQKVGLHEVSSGKTLRFLEGHSRGVLTVAFLPNDAGLLTAGIDETMRLWDADGGQSLRTFANHTRAVSHLALRWRPSTIGNAPPWVASVSEDRTLRLWQPTIGRMVRFSRLESTPLAVAWSADGQALFVACNDGRVRTVNPETAAVLNDQPAIDGVAYCLAVAPDGSLLVGGHNGQLRRILLK